MSIQHVNAFLHTGQLGMPRNGESETIDSHRIQHHQATGGFVGEAFQFVGDV